MSWHDCVKVNLRNTNVMIQTDTSVLFCFVYRDMQAADCAVKHLTTSLGLHSAHLVTCITKYAVIQAVVHFVTDVLRRCPCTVQASNAHVVVSNNSVDINVHKSKTVAVSVVLNSPDFRGFA